MNLTPWLINQFRDGVMELESQINTFPDSIYFLRLSHPAYGNDLVFSLAKDEEMIELRIFDNLTNFYFYNGQEENPFHKPFQNAMQVIRKPYDSDDDLMITHDGMFSWGAMDLLVGEVRLQPERSRLKEIIHLVHCLTIALPHLANQHIKEGEILAVEMDQQDKIISTQLKVDRIDVSGNSIFLDEETLETFRSFKKNKETLQVDVVGVPDFSTTVSQERLIFKNFILFCSNRHQYHDEFGHYCDEDIIDHLALSFQEYFLLYGVPSRIQVDHLWVQFALEPFCQQLGINLVVQESLLLCDQLRDELMEAMQLENMNLLEETNSLN